MFLRTFRSLLVVFLSLINAFALAYACHSFGCNITMRKLLNVYAQLTFKRQNKCRKCQFSVYSAMFSQFSRLPLRRSFEFHSIAISPIAAEQIVKSSQFYSYFLEIKTFELHQKQKKRSNRTIVKRILSIYRFNFHCFCLIARKYHHRMQSYKTKDDENRNYSHQIRFQSIEFSDSLSFAHHLISDREKRIWEKCRN